mmetsp:Transcript_7331/g.13391  ORF Transcript_7331/g.13391 Transcript_7331/m.13391 type:complete len:251 (+) Transcript_7331:1491-2243(+)
MAPYLGRSSAFKQRLELPPASALLLLAARLDSSISSASRHTPALAPHRSLHNPVHPASSRLATSLIRPHVALRRNRDRASRYEHTAHATSSGRNRPVVRRSGSPRDASRMSGTSVMTACGWRRRTFSWRRWWWLGWATWFVGREGGGGVNADDEDSAAAALAAGAPSRRGGRSRRATAAAAASAPSSSIRSSPEEEEGGGEGLPSPPPSLCPRRCPCRWLRRPSEEGGDSAASSIDGIPMDRGGDPSMAS